MGGRLHERLRLEFEPVAISFTDEKPQGAVQFEEGARGCAAAMLLAASRGTIALFDEASYGCPGAGLGLCFGDTFSKRMEYLLSTGADGAREDGLAFDGLPDEGERFNATPALARSWKESFPVCEAPEKYVVFEPIGFADERAEQVGGGKPPDLVHVLANPDQLSALVILAGFNRGEMLNVIAPFVSACQCIAVAYDEAKKERPKAVMGLFDISQRHRFPSDVLSLTVPYRLYREMEDSLDESCLATEAWRRIDGRWLNG